jgi:hypothetical protein
MAKKNEAKEQATALLATGLQYRKSYRVRSTDELTDIVHDWLGHGQEITDEQDRLAGKVYDRVDAALRKDPRVVVKESDLLADFYHASFHGVRRCISHRPGGKS